MTIVPPVALVFPGQGAQYRGMTSDLVRFDVAARLLDRADRALGYSLGRIMHDERGDDLKRTVHTQPAVFVHSMMLLEMLREKAAFAPVASAGHSLGEYTALVAAGALGFEEALDIIRVRASAMDAAQPPGVCGMAAVMGLSVHDASALVEASRGDGALELANFNAPDQMTASGTVAALERLAQAARTYPKARVVFLEVSSAFHTQLMGSARVALRARLEKVVFQSASFPVVSNVTGEVYPFPGGKELLVDQVVRPVLWEDCVRTMVRDGAATLVEVGPGKVLTGLVKRIDKSVCAVNVSTAEDVSRLAEALG